MDLTPPSLSYLEKTTKNKQGFAKDTDSEVFSVPMTG